MNESAERPKIPWELTDRFTNLTKENESSMLAEAVSIYLFYDNKNNTSKGSNKNNNNKTNNNNNNHE